MSNKGGMMQTFEPDQLVLVRENDTQVWRLTHYSHTVEGRDWNITIDGKVWASPFIIPYAGNEHLLGSTESITSKWEPKPGELVAVRHSSIEKWKARVFRYPDNNIGFACDNEMESDHTCFWYYCEPLHKHFIIPKE